MLPRGFTSCDGKELYFAPNSLSYHVRMQRKQHTREAEAGTIRQRTRAHVIQSTKLSDTASLETNSPWRSPSMLSSTLNSCSPLFVLRVGSLVLQSICFGSLAVYFLRALGNVVAPPDLRKIYVRCHSDPLVHDVVSRALLCINFVPSPFPPSKRRHEPVCPINI